MQSKRFSLKEVSWIAQIPTKFVNFANMKAGLTNKQIRVLALKLPDQFTIQKQKVTSTGGFLISKGITQLGDGRPLEKRARYTYIETRQIPVNHFKKMLSLQRSNGAVAVIKYVDNIIETTKDLNAPKKVGGIALETE